MTSRKTARYPAMEEQANRPKQVMNWSAIEWCCQDLMGAITSTNIGIKRIVAVARGGMVPAAIIANGLGIRNVTSLSVSSYVEMAKQGLEVERLPLHVISTLNSADTLFIDDIVDSGDTYRYINHQFPRSWFAALVVRYKSPQKPPFHARMLENDDWIVFPWEKLGS